eukprot:3082475-Rhodomonas_salina.1
MRYCSSDAFVGDAAADTPAHAADTPESAADTALNTTDTASNGARRWHFRGQVSSVGFCKGSRQPMVNGQRSTVTCHSLVTGHC